LKERTDRREGRKKNKRKEGKIREIEGSWRK
jgi:hypothetical protein